MTHSFGTRRTVLLKQRPKGEPKPSDFDIDEQVIHPPEPGEVLTRTLWLSIDPYMRGRLSDRKSYAAPVQIGEMMTGETAGEVIASTVPEFAVGDFVVVSRGWQTHSISKAASLTKVPKDGAPLSTYLGVLGMPGTTAYTGMTDIGKPKPGETVVISAASGAVGSVAGQLAKRAVGIAGGPDKCLFVQEFLGFDDCIDHQSMDLGEALAEACPHGIDVYFENVGGEVQRAVFNLLNPFARVIMCGMVSQYNEAEFPPGPNLGFIVGKRILMQGFIVSDKPERFPEWRALAAPWIADSTLKYREDVIDGLENAPDALNGILGGRNFGKLLVRVAEEAI
jgi:NADPH-dependent curcumin reductase CurA